MTNDSYNGGTTEQREALLAQGYSLRWVSALKEGDECALPDDNGEISYFWATNIRSFAQSDGSLLYGWIAKSDGDERAMSLSAPWPIWVTPRLNAATPSPSLTIPDDQWTPIEKDLGDDSDLLGPTLTINGLPMCLEAWRVITDGDVQRTLSGSELLDDERFAALHGSAAADGPFQTTTINGRDYIIIATPHC